MNVKYIKHTGTSHSILCFCGRLDIHYTVGDMGMSILLECDLYRSRVNVTGIQYLICTGQGSIQ